MMADLESVINVLITDNGLTTSEEDDAHIIVENAEPGLLTYEIIETPNSVDVILHYDKKLKE